MLTIQKIHYPTNQIMWKPVTPAATNQQNINAKTAMRMILSQNLVKQKTRTMVKPIMLQYMKILHLVFMVQIRIVAYS